MRSLSGLLVFAAATTALPQRQDRVQDLIARANRVIPVVVGGPQDTFVPNVVRANVGDVVQFQFSNGNHTVTQSAPETPCQPLQASVSTAIHSGHIPFKEGQTTVGTFNMPVVALDTMFFYCATGPHCQEGQVMVMNPVNDDQIVQYNKLAAGAAANTDGTFVMGGAPGQINLADAAFTPAPAAAAAPGAPPAAAAPAAAPSAAPAEAAPAEAAPAEAAPAAPAA